MKFDDLKRLYDQYRGKYGKEAYRYISKLLEELLEHPLLLKGLESHWVRTTHS